jgi:hypothetical protein
MVFPTPQPPSGTSQVRVADRRGFLCMAGLAALGGLAGCRKDSVARNVPPGGWPSDRPMAAMPATAATVGAPAELASPVGPVLARCCWTTEPPDVANMVAMVPITHVTIHHDGLDTLIETDDRAATAARIELYRRGHRGRGWADIGYHFVIDRAGCVWEGRSLAWQGAHVKNRNPGNVGILVMGNFEIQRPTEAQLASLERCLAAARTTWNVPWSRVLSHREWPGATTLCPGRNLQERFTAIRGDVASVA